MLVFPAEQATGDQPDGAISPTLAANADDLVIDPAEWTGSGLAASIPNVTRSRPSSRAGPGEVPTLSEFDSAKPVPGWKTVSHNEITLFSSSFEYDGWGYPGIGEIGACY